MFSKHVTKDLSAYCHGALPPEQMRQVAEHLIGCNRCRQEFEEVKLGVKLAEQLPAVSAPLTYSAMACSSRVSRTSRGAKATTAPPAKASLVM